MSSAPTTDERFDALTKNVRAHLNGVPGLDDISALLVSVPSNQRKKVRFNVSPIAVAKSSFAEWRLDLSYGAQELGYIDVVPAVLGCVTQLHILQMHQGALFLVFSELFNNALDHGLLRLESSLKSAEGGFEIYLTQREERLKLLNTGRIDISFRLHQEEERVVLDMHITDTGPGFDFEECLDARSILALGASNTRAYGRGIAIVKNLCEKVQYSGNGNKVWVRFLVSEKVEPEPAILEDSAWGV